MSIMKKRMCKESQKKENIFFEQNPNVITVIIGYLDLPGLIYLKKANKFLNSLISEKYTSIFIEVAERELSIIKDRTLINIFNEYTKMESDKELTPLEKEFRLVYLIRYHKEFFSINDDFFEKNIKETLFNKKISFLNKYSKYLNSKIESLNLNGNNFTITYNIKNYNNFSNLKILELRNVNITINHCYILFRNSINLEKISFISCDIKLKKEFNYLDMLDNLSNLDEIVIIENENNLYEFEFKNLFIKKALNIILSKNLWKIFFNVQLNESELLKSDIILNKNDFSNINYKDETENRKNEIYLLVKVEEFGEILYKLCYKLIAPSMSVTNSKLIYNSIFKTLPINIVYLHLGNNFRDYLKCFHLFNKLRKIKKFDLGISSFPKENYSFRENIYINKDVTELENRSFYVNEDEKIKVINEFLYYFPNLKEIKLSNCVYCILEVNNIKKNIIENKFKEKNVSIITLGKKTKIVCFEREKSAIREIIQELKNSNKK